MRLTKLGVQFPICEWRNRCKFSGFWKTALDRLRIAFTEAPDAENNHSELANVQLPTA